MEKIQFKLDVFEGPLDLLLHLISKHKLNINDIEISKLLEQYIDYIEQMRLADLNVASEFLEMAALLIYIKTVSLLPKSEEADELKQKLQIQLMELSAIKIVSKKLSAMFIGFDVFTREKTLLEIDKTYTRSHLPEELAENYKLLHKKVLAKKPPTVAEFTPIVEKRIVSVMTKIIFVLRKLYKNNQISFEEFYQTPDRGEMVATFLAMLELIKSKRISVDDDNKMVYFLRGKA